MAKSGNKKTDDLHISGNSFFSEPDPRKIETRGMRVGWGCQSVLRTPTYSVRLFRISTCKLVACCSLFGTRHSIFGTGFTPTKRSHLFHFSFSRIHRFTDGTWPAFWISPRPAARRACLEFYTNWLTGLRTDMSRYFELGELNCTGLFANSKERFEKPCPSI